MKNLVKPRSQVCNCYLTAVAESGSRTPTPPRRTELQYSPPSTRTATARCRRTSGSCSAARRSSPGSNEEQYIHLESRPTKNYHDPILMFKQPILCIIHNILFLLFTVDKSLRTGVVNIYSFDTLFF